MKLAGMERWGEMTPAAKVELLGNMIVDLASRIPDVAAGEANTLATTAWVTQEQHEALSEVVGGMIEMHKQIEGDKSSTAATVASLAARVESLEGNVKSEFANMAEQFSANVQTIRSEVAGRLGVLETHAGDVSTHMTVESVKAMLDEMVAEIQERIDKKFTAPTGKPSK